MRQRRNLHGGWARATPGGLLVSARDRALSAVGRFAVHKERRAILLQLRMQTNPDADRQTDERTDADGVIATTIKGGGFCWPPKETFGELESSSASTRPYDLRQRRRFWQLSDKTARQKRRVHTALNSSPSRVVLQIRATREHSGRPHEKHSDFTQMFRHETINDRFSRVPR